MEYANLLKKVLLLSAAVLTVSAAAFAQTKATKVTGKVTDEKGNPMAGVTVVVVGSNNLGTTTGAGGDYVLNSPPHAVSLFSLSLAIKSRKSL